MFTTSLYAIVSVSLLSLIALCGVFALSMKQTSLDKMVSYLVALAAGAMLGNGLFHLLPETFEHATSERNAGALVLVGILACYLLEKALNLRCHRSHGGCNLQAPKDDHEDAHDHSGGHGHAHRAEFIHPTGWISLFSHSLHNFADGVLIAASYMISIPTGLATTFAIVLHEVPMELGGFGVLVNAGFKRLTAVFVNMLSGVVALIGTVVTLWLGSEIPGMNTVLTPIGAGTVLYIATVGLMPQLLKEKDARKSRIQFLILLLGVVAMYGASFMEH